MAKSSIKAKPELVHHEVEKSSLHIPSENHSWIFLSSVGPVILRGQKQTREGSRQAARFVHSNYFDSTEGCILKMVSDLGLEPLYIALLASACLCDLRRNLFDCYTWSSVPLSPLSVSTATMYFCRASMYWYTLYSILQIRKATPW